MKTQLIFIVFLNLLFGNVVVLSQEPLSYLTDIKKATSESKIKSTPTYVFNAYSLEFKLEKITSEMAGTHPFGEMIAKKIYLLNQYYTSEETLYPGNPVTKTIIKKPVIYDAVKRIEKYLKRAEKKGEIPLITATSIMNKVLDVAINIITADTKSFETALESSTDPNTRIDLFVNKVHLVY